MAKSDAIRPAPTWDVTNRRRVLVVARDAYRGPGTGHPMAQHLTQFGSGPQATRVLRGWRGFHGPRLGWERA